MGCRRAWRRPSRSSQMRDPVRCYLVAHPLQAAPQAIVEEGDLDHPGCPAAVRWGGRHRPFGERPRVERDANKCWRLGGACPRAECQGRGRADQQPDEDMLSSKTLSFCNPRLSSTRDSNERCCNVYAARQGLRTEHQLRPGSRAAVGPLWVHSHMGPGAGEYKEGQSMVGLPYM